MEADRGAGARQRELACALRDLAWTIHRPAPENTGVDAAPVSELAVLKQALATPGITVTEVARSLGIRQSNTSATVRCLAEKGLLRRESSPADRRVTMLVPTEKLLAERELVESVWSGTIHDALARLSTEQIEALEAAVDALHTLNRALRPEHPERGTQ